MLRSIGRAVAGTAVAFLALVAVYRLVPPPVTPLMLWHAPARGLTKDWVRLDDVAPALVRAVIAAEDARFFEHGGVDWSAIRDARAYNARHGHEPRRGGSTITMQCARNVFLWQGKSYLRKVLEIAVAYVIERAWGKRRILEVYLNVIEWGSGLYGAEAAARRYFGVSARALRPAQAALLASVLPNPLRWKVSARRAGSSRGARSSSVAPCGSHWRRSSEPRRRLVLPSESETLPSHRDPFHHHGSPLDAGNALANLNPVE